VIFRRSKTWLVETMVVLGKDLAIEAVTGEIVATSGFFAVMVTVLASLAFATGPGEKGNVAPGVLWLAVTFACVLGIGRTWHREREEGALLGLLVAPIARSAIFAGKAAAVFFFAIVVELVTVPTAAFLLGFDLWTFAAPLAVIALLADIGVAATGTLFGAMTVRSRARDLVLASVLLPLLAPTLGCAVGATRELFDGARLVDLGDYLELMALLDLTFGVAGLWLFGWLVDE
jgi:heme exporter protein B